MIPAFYRQATIPLFSPQSRISTSQYSTTLIQSHPPALALLANTSTSFTSANWASKFLSSVAQTNQALLVLKPPREAIRHGSEADYTIDISKYVERVKDRVYLCACIKDWVGSELVFLLEERKFVREENIDTSLALYFVQENCVVLRWVTFKDDTDGSIIRIMDSHVWD